VRDLHFFTPTFQVQALDEEFHFVLIAEHFDESLGKQMSILINQSTQ
jgi:hypothetical protein